MNDRPQFISYSQNSEDVLLWRALGHVKNGFYIDVGASDPVEHSVTKAFYDAGWHGINIEPLPSHIEVFREQRPRDLSLAIAAGDENGSLTLYDVPDVRGWASPQADVAELHRAEGHAVAELTVPVRTLASVCEVHVQGEIHFLKIDVEGFEGAVLQGMDFTRWRPWVLVIEATLPNSRETNHAAWEHLVTGQRYRHVWFDGLNRYYVADEHPELLAHFGIQPNVFDDYISWHLDRAWAATRTTRQSLDDTQGVLHDTQDALKNTEKALQSSESGLRETQDALRTTERALHEAEKGLLKAELRAETALREAREQADALQRDRQAAVDEAARLHGDLAQAHASNHQQSLWAREIEARLVATLNSTSWKVTRPLRGVGSILNRLRDPALLRRALLRATRIQALRRTVIPLLLRNPALARRVSGALHAARTAEAQAANPAQSSDQAGAPAVAVPHELRHLPVSVRGVLADLQRARARASGPRA